MADLRIKDVSSLLTNFFDADKLSRGEKVSSFFSSWASSEPRKGVEAMDPEKEKESEKVEPTSTLEDVADPSLRALLSSLRKTMQGKP